MKEVRNSRHCQYKWLKYSAATLATTMVVPAAMEQPGELNADQEQDMPFNAMVNSLQDLQETMQVSTAEAATVTEISSAMDLHNKVRTNPSGSFKLTSNIDLSVAGNWQPIEEFSGTLNGNGHTISNLTINRPSSDRVGLFSNAEGEIKNLSITNANVNGESKVGILSGIDNSNIINVQVSGIVRGTNQVGGLVGHSRNSSSSTLLEYKKLKVDAEVNGVSKVGGIIGESTGNYSNSNRRMAGTKISKSFSKGKVIADGDAIGGIVGYADGDKNVYNDEDDAVVLEDVYSSADVEGSDYVGGISGQLSRSQVSNVIS